MQQPMRVSLDLVRQVTGEDLSGVDREALIARLERLVLQLEELQAPPRADARGVITLTLENLGLHSAVVRAVLATEKARRLN